MADQKYQCPKCKHYFFANPVGKSQIVCPKCGAVVWSKH